MNTPVLKWPADFDDYAWQLEAKGWFAGLEIEFCGVSINPIFYDAARLLQDVHSELSTTGSFFEPNLVVVDRVCRSSIEAVISKLATSGELDRMLPTSK